MNLATRVRGLLAASGSPIRGSGWLVVAVVLVAAAWVVARLRTDPQFVFLDPAAPGEWIGPDEPPRLAANVGTRTVESEFACRFGLERTVAEWTIEFVALGAAVVALDGRILHSEIGGSTEGEVRAATDTDWKRRRILRADRPLGPGPHELLVVVANVDGPPPLSLEAKGPGVATGPGREWSDVAGVRRPLRIATAAAAPPEVALRHPTVVQGLVRTAPWWGAIAVGVGAFAWRLSGPGPSRSGEPTRPDRPYVEALLSPGALHWLLLALWAVRVLHKTALIPHDLGMDLRWHLEYVLHVVQEGRIPLANEGWQHFQSPLYYLVAAAYGMVFARHAELPDLCRSLRVVPLVCGLVQIELCYRVLRDAFPQRRDLQSAGLLVAALLPMHAAISQFVGNEPLAGCFAAAAVWQLLRIGHEPWRAASVAQLALLGLSVGLSLLTKATVLVLLPLIGGFAFRAAVEDPAADAEPDGDEPTAVPAGASVAPAAMREAARKDGRTPTGRPLGSRARSAKSSSNARRDVAAPDAPRKTSALPGSERGAVPSPPARLRRLFLATAVWPTVAAVVCGWYYARNWILLGKPFVGGWDPERGFVWWQDPGYRTVADLSTFGRALHRPIYATLGSFWDGLYSTLWTDGMLSGAWVYDHRPPWHVDLHVALAGLSLVPSTFLCIGAWRGVRSLRRGESGPVAVATALLLALVAALGLLFLRLPAYSTVKASYTLGLLPAYALLVAAGLDPFLRTRAGRAAAAGMLAAWAMCSYATFFATVPVESG